MRVKGAAEQIGDLRVLIGGLPLPAGHGRSLEAALARAGGDEQDAELQGDAERIRAVAACAP